MTLSRFSKNTWRRAALSLFGACTAWIFLAAPAAADFYQGLKAYDQRNYTEAARTWRKSAEQGDVRSQFRLGVLYEKGTGVPKDAVKAYYWYTVAQKRGNADAGLAAQLLKTRMSKVQVAQATRMAAGFRPGRGQIAARVRPNEPSITPPTPQAGSLAETVAGSQLRRTVRGDSGLRYDIWKFSPSGTVKGNYSEEVNSAAISAYTKQDSDTGRWTVQDGALCITWSKWRNGRQTCYRLVKGAGAQDWSATDMASGRTWKAKIFR